MFLVKDNVILTDLGAKWSELEMNFGLYILMKSRLDLERFSTDFEHGKFNHFLYRAQVTITRVNIIVYRLEFSQITSYFTQLHSYCGCR